MPKPPSRMLLGVLARMVDEGRSLRFSYYENRTRDGSVVLRPRDTNGLAWEARDGEHSGPRVESVVASVVSKALDDGHLEYSRRILGPSPYGGDLHDGYADARPTPSGLTLLDEHRWRLVTNENPGYVVLKRKSWDPPHVPPGPVLRIERKTENRYYVDPTDIGPRSDGGRCRDLRIKGHDAGKVWVSADDVLSVVEDPTLHVAASTLPIDRINAISETRLKESEEIEALLASLPEATAIRKRWAEERVRIGREFDDRLKAVGG